MTDRDLVESIFPKYRKQRHSRNVGFNLQRIVRYENGSLVYPKLSYVLACEGEFDAMALESLGYPAVAIKMNRETQPELAFRGVPLVFIVADNDPPRLRNGMEVKEGIEAAHALRKQIGKGRIILPPNPFKDANDVVLAGEVGKWLKPYDIEPILLDF